MFALNFIAVVEPAKAINHFKEQGLSTCKTIKLRAILENANIHCLYLFTGTPPTSKFNLLTLILRKSSSSLSSSALSSLPEPLCDESSSLSSSSPELSSSSSSSLSSLLESSSMMRWRRWNLKANKLFRHWIIKSFKAYK